MRIRNFLAAAALAASALVGFSAPAFAAEEGGEHKYADHNAELCAEILEEGGTVDECHEAPSPILPEPNEIIYGGTAFLVLLGVMSKFAYPAIKKGMDDRTERIRESIDEADKLKAEAAAALSQHQASVADAKGEANRIVEEARQAAEAVRADILARAEAEAAEVKAKAREDVEAGKARAIAELQGQVGDLTIALAEKVVERSLDDATNRQLIDNYINNLGNN
ncbi:MAG: F0F1 ATP synthase subunit B [Acidimicrobiales bacterium]|nr:F0F1 ATP synthase subunit B [Acidimicrobiales bacterium]